MKREIDIERNVRSALARLKTRSPAHPELAERAASGRRLINISNVALEAGISRTLIGHDACAYPELRKEIIAAAACEPIRQPKTALVADLRATIRTLARQIELKDTYIAELLLELQRLGGDPSPGEGNVIDFRRRHRKSRSR